MLFLLPNAAVVKSFPCADARVKDCGERSSEKPAWPRRFAFRIAIPSHKVNLLLISVSPGLDPRNQSQSCLVLINTRMAFAPVRTQEADPDKKGIRLLVRINTTQTGVPLCPAGVKKKKKKLLLSSEFS